MGIEIKKIVKKYKFEESTTFALNEIDLNIEDGEMVAIMGPSGSGKSTLLNILGFIDVPTEGEYFLDGKSTKSLSENNIAKIRNEKIGFVFQYFALIKAFKVIDNVALPLLYRKMKNKDRMKASEKCLEKLGILNQKNKKISQLSGGQQQRVAIARALVGNPSIILADEPTGALDQKTGDEIIGVLKEINKEGRTVIIVTHDINIANKCDRILKIVDGKLI